MSPTTKDAVNLLVKDHKDVKAMFKIFADLTDRSVVGKKKIADSICHALTCHMQLEEEIFYPAVRTVIKDDDMMDEAIVEHAAARELITEIRGMDPGDDLYDAKVHVLSEQIDHHVGEEETDMFPKVRKTSLDLVELGEEMNARKAQLEVSKI